ncbi:nicotinate-nucleotide--dimethylbenzimidazole phosphoribosyltransferase [Alteromonas gracilis]
MSLLDLEDLPAPDDGARAAVAERAAQVLRPAGALARLDAVAAHVAAWQRSSEPAVRRPVGLVAAADHGVAVAGVSAYPTEVTAAMTAAFRAEVATVSALARVAGAELAVLDVGVGRPTADIRTEDALTPERAAAIVAEARERVAALDADLLVLGEMGIGNTTAASAVSLALLGGSAEDWVGPGTGVSGAAREAKVDACHRAAARVASERDPVEVLRRVGGAELLALAAACVEARRRSLPVLVDGFVVTAALLPLSLARPGALDHCLAGHRSPEPGHTRLLDHLGLDPLLDLGMRLGEASGAMAAVPLVAMACAAVVEVPTFAEWAERA